VLLLEIHLGLWFLAVDKSHIQDLVLQYMSLLFSELVLTTNGQQ